ncbi:MAG: hypothetical protein ACAI44_21005, partial [Candidatus Sericytochromatia bacterium]
SISSFYRIAGFSHVLLGSRRPIGLCKSRQDMNDENESESVILGLAAHFQRGVSAHCPDEPEAGRQPVR